MFGLKLTQAIYCLTGFSALFSVILIIASSLDLAYLQYRDITRSLVQIQIIRIMTEVILLANLTVFIYAIRNASLVRPTLLFSSAVVYMVAVYCRKYLMVHTVFTRMPQDVEQSPIGTLENYPITAGFHSLLTTSIDMARWHLCLQFCWKYQICGVRIRDRIGVVRIRSILMILPIFMLMGIVHLMWNQTQLYRNKKVRTKFTTDYWYTLSSCVYFLNSTVAPIKMSIDFILGLRMDAEKKLHQFYRTLLILSPIHGSIKMVTLVQERDVILRGDKELFLNYLTHAVDFVNVTGCLVLVFLYRKYLKHTSRHPTAGIIGNEATGNKDNSFRLSRRKLLNIRTVDVGRIIVSDTQLGSGCWSTVYLGDLSLSKFYKKSIQPVAIKVISGTSDPNMTTAIYEELKNTSRVLTHPNLVHFIGTCFLNQDQIKKPLGGVNIVMEYCEKGSLELFLRNLKHCSGFDTEQQLWRWSLEIASGMEYLAEQKLVHGDLSTRNILLDEKLVAKISDFGMTRKLYEYQQYARIEQSKFPWKWMSPESLEELKFTLKSDIYSYGITLWEIYSLGQSPWMEFSWTSNFVENLRSGERLEKPILASRFLYNEVMLQCWRFEANERPDISQIQKLLQANHPIENEKCW